MRHELATLAEDPMLRIHIDPALTPGTGIATRADPRRSFSLPADTVRHDSRIRMLSGLNALLGLWLVLAPRLIGAPSREVATSGFVVGICVLLLSVTRLLRRHTAAMSWAIVVLAAWTIMSPFVLPRLTGDTRIWNYVIIGILMATIEAVSLTSSASQGSWLQRGS